FSAGASATVGYGVSVSAHLSNSRTESERAYVDNQTRIVAGDDLNINVGDHTQLDGAILASQEGDVTLDTE
ncbi:hemagglutinin repeat-containing protein, partial [Curvivirga aplysinae]